jgi:hypothetical protein
MSSIKTNKKTIKWYNTKGKLHRDYDLPAIEYPDGNKQWYVNGNLHRDNGLPAIEYANGNKQWYVNGNLHRDNGLPAIERSNGDKEWYVNGKRHRDNGLPAIEFTNGEKHWLQSGIYHRLGGLPAIVNANGHNYWCIYNKNYTYKQVINYYQILKGFGRHCLRKIRMRKQRRLRWIHGELLCMPVKGSYPGGQDYHKMISYFMSM